jgi:translin
MLADLADLAQAAQTAFKTKHAARELALPKSRSAIRHCANAIRAIHRDDFSTAQALLHEAATALGEMRHDLAGHPDIFYAGFVEDAQKEYAEAAITLAIVQDQPLPVPTDLAVDWAPYLNGMGEAIGELRRHALDALRRGDYAASERLLQAMDDMFGVLTALDFPDAITNNLRRTADVARGIIEKTRGDLTTAAVQAHLSDQLTRLAAQLAAHDAHS